jgi:myo-inositol-1(or 4)-monophosphatase
MKSLQAELALAQATVKEALKVLGGLRPHAALFGCDPVLPKEMKSASDRILEKVIVARLRVTGLGILSEEAGQLVSGSGDALRWVVDPLDGTVNFIRGLAPCSISVALCCGDAPVMGVIGEFPSGNLAWGGAGVGAFWSDLPIRVSTVDQKQQAVICTGIPSRFKFDEKGKEWIASTLAPYTKVRMLGAASLSLLHVAKGSAEVYSERGIMIWDIAAGLAIVEGAGGSFTMTPALHPDSFDVFASNGLILDG